MQRLALCFALLVIAAASPASAAIAQEEVQETSQENTRNEPRAGFDFERHDTNDDGLLTEAEWQDAVNAEDDFTNADQNEDGYLDEDELRAYDRDAGMDTGRVTPEDDYLGTGHDPLSQGAADNEPVSQETETAAAGGMNRDARGETDDASAAQSSPIDNSLFVTRGRDAEQSLSSMDSSGDGRISRQEAEQDDRARQNFVSWDSNQDGYLDQAELDAGNQDSQRNEAQQDITFSDDADGDGRIARDEAGNANEFETLDANNDDYLDRAEVNYEPGERTAADAAGFQELDADNDARLSRAEAANDTYIDINFDTWDRDQDGNLEEEEVNNGWLEESSTTHDELW